MSVRNSYYWFLAFLISSSIGLTLLGTNTYAFNTTFSQEILPINCIFTIVNAGTGELHYVTPQACGVYNPSLRQSSNQTSSASSKSNYFGPTVAPSKPETNSVSAALSTRLPWQPLTKISNTQFSKTSGGTFFSTDSISLITLVIVVLFVVAIAIF